MMHAKWILVQWKRCRSKFISASNYTALNYNKIMNCRGGGGGRSLSNSRCHAGTFEVRLAKTTKKKKKKGQSGKVSESVGIRTEDILNTCRKS
jgi:hypothetical protein